MLWLRARIAKCPFVSAAIQETSSQELANWKRRLTQQVAHLRRAAQARAPAGSSFVVDLGTTIEILGLLRRVCAVFVASETAVFSSQMARKKPYRLVSIPKACYAALPRFHAHQVRVSSVFCGSVTQ